MAVVIPRWRQHGLTRALETRRVVLLTGARQVGKTTLARSIASANVEFRTLDDQTLRQAAEADPISFVRHRARTLIIDEIQRVPALLPAIKQAVDDDNRPGQYLLTGSADVTTLSTAQESLAGRVAKLRLRPLTQGEFEQATPTFLERAFEDRLGKTFAPVDRDQLLQLAFRGGYPEAAAFADRKRRQWHTDYATAMLDRDLRDVAQVRRRQAIEDLLRITAAWSSKLMDVSAIGAGLSLQRPTLETYLAALRALFLIDRVEPWIDRDYDRVGRHAKLFMADSGLMASLLGWQIEQVKLDPDRSGKLVETFAYNEIAAQVEAGDGLYRLHHYRDREKREIDLVIEREDGALLGLEIKSGATVESKDFKNLGWFKSNLAKGKPFTGLTLYAGNNALSFGAGMKAIPFSALWN